MAELDLHPARTLGVSVADVAQTLQLSLAGQRYGYFIKDGKQYQVIGQVARGNRDALPMRSQLNRTLQAALLMAGAQVARGSVR